jgi:hypothetical protein
MRVTGLHASSQGRTREKGRVRAKDKTLRDRQGSVRETGFRAKARRAGCTRGEGTVAERSKRLSTPERRTHVTKSTVVGPGLSFTVARIPRSGECFLLTG